MSTAHRAIPGDKEVGLISVLIHGASVRTCGDFTFDIWIGPASDRLTLVHHSFDRPGLGSDSQSAHHVGLAWERALDGHATTAEQASVVCKRRRRIGVDARRLCGPR